MRQTISPLLLIAGILIAGIFSSCDQLSPKKKAYEPSFSIEPSHKKRLIWGLPSRGYYDMLGPLVNYMNGKLKNVQIEMIASGNLTDFLDRKKRKEFDISVDNGAGAVDEEKTGYTVVGKISDDDAYRGVILVNRDSAIHGFGDLTGRTISSAGKSALAGHMMPMYFLHEHGVNIRTGFKILDVGSFESIILNIYQGNCSAGFCMLSTWQGYIKKRPEVTSKVELRWTTPALPNLALIFRSDLDTRVSGELKALIFSAPGTGERGKIAAAPGRPWFVPADSNSYSPMKKFLREYNSIIQ